MCCLVRGGHSNLSCPVSPALPYPFTTSGMGLVAGFCVVVPSDLLLFRESINTYNTNIIVFVGLDSVAGFARVYG